eukprot:CAMPEP_0171257284 /NCGR_PEP_ID=MMETSP0790-20130122/53762_1 /TAXON_ID=2925 /ORGANISM="Alexandrium catenella, Strain OF101" /LENGTH=45 /DNA_ID= /DNA_START= /DNA_END= /DNA_ORIENTATION=
MALALQSDFLQTPITGQVILQPAADRRAPDGTCDLPPGVGCVQDP